MVKKSEALVLDANTFTTDPQLYEHLYNVIQEAQAMGSIVHIVTILPPPSGDKSGLVATVQGCKPGDAICPK